MVCEMVVAVLVLSVALVCLLAVGVYLACGACGVHELACVWSECVFFWSACRVCVCCVRVLRFVRVCVRVLAC